MICVLMLIVISSKVTFLIRIKQVLVAFVLHGVRHMHTIQHVTLYYLLPDGFLVNKGFH